MFLICEERYEPAIQNSDNVYLSFVFPFPLKRELKRVMYGNITKDSSTRGYNLSSLKGENVNALLQDKLTEQRDQCASCRGGE